MFGGVWTFSKILSTRKKSRTPNFIVIFLVSNDNKGIL